MNVLIVFNIDVKLKSHLRPSGILTLAFFDSAYWVHHAVAQQRTMSAPDENCPHDERKKRPRTAFTASQIKSLESEFEKNKYLSVSKRTQLSKQLSLSETQVRPVSQTQVRP